MAPTDPLEPLIAFFYIFTGAVTNPFLALMVVGLMSMTRRRWPLLAGLPALAALDAAFIRATETHPPAWTILATGEALAVLVQGAVAAVMVGAARHWAKRDER